MNDDTRDVMRALEALEAAHKDRYINTREMSSAEFNAGIEAIHAQKSAAIGAGPCGCMGCREVRSSRP